jgi:hypothetical protein
MNSTKLRLTANNHTKGLTNSDRLDKIRAYYIDFQDLTPTQEEARQRIEACRALLVEGYSKAQSAKMLMSTYGIATSQAYQIVRDTYDIFGDVAAVSKEGMRIMQLEQYQVMAEQLKSNGEHALWLECMKRIDKIAGLEITDKDKDNAFIHLLNLPKTILLTNDFAAYTEEIEAENSGYEEI